MKVKTVCSPSYYLVSIIHETPLYEFLSRHVTYFLPLSFKFLFSNNSFCSCFLMWETKFHTHMDQLGFWSLHNFNSIRVEKRVLIQNPIKALLCLEGDGLANGKNSMVREHYSYVSPDFNKVVILVPTIIITILLRIRDLCSCVFEQSNS